jgi:hypothetical protein
MNTNKQTGETTMNESYKDKFNATMKQFGIDSLDDLKSDEEKKKFFKAVDKSHDAVNEMLSIAEEAVNEMMSTEMAEMMKEMMKEMSSEMNMLKAETDPTKVEMMKKEMMMKAMKKMPEMSEMMMKEMMKKMDEYGSMNAMKEAVSPAQQAAIAISKKEKEKKEMKDMDDMEEKHVPGHNEKHVPGHDDDKPEMSVPEMYAQEISKMNAMKKTRTMMTAMKTGDDDMTPDAVKLNAMIKDPHKSKEDKPMKDMNATYMKSDVRADVKNGGGADMSKVQDAPKMMAAMKKINAMYKTEKYHDTKSGSLNDTLAQMHLNEQKSVLIKVQEFSSLVETYLAKGGVVGNISEAIREVELNKTLKLGEAREFITLYNKHFLTNYRAEEFIDEGLSAGQKKLPPALQKAILAKQGKKETKG